MAAETGSGEPAPFVVRRGGPDDVDEALRVLREAYDRSSFTREWHRWKHLEAPWGPSTLYVAEDDGGFLAVFFSLPWPYRVRRADGSIVDVDGARLVDGATLPPSRGRGVLPRLCFEDLRTWDPSDREGVVVATATPAAQRSHAKNGATTLTHIESTFGLPQSVRPARLTTGDEVLDSLTPDLAAPATVGVLGSAWTPAALRWRTDPRSERSYDAAALRAGTGPNGLVFRIGSLRGLRVLVPVLDWGSPGDRRRLTGAVAFRHGCALVLADAGASVPPPPIRPLRPSGESIVCVWDRRAPSVDRPATQDDAWALTMADLEGLI